MNIFEIIAEQKIQDAFNKGLFDNLPGKGKPLKLEDLSGVSPEDRMANKILKNAGILPQELQVRNEIGELEKKIAACDSEEEKNNLKVKINRMRTMYNIMIEKNKKR